MVFEGTIILEKFPGKGGWTYAKIPVAFEKSSRPFGWQIVSGTIDELSFDYIKLMPAGDGTLFLAVKATWRKILRKEAGDPVHIRLKIHPPSLELPEVVRACFKLEPESEQRFNSLIEMERCFLLDQIRGAKTETEREQRLVELMSRLR